MMHFAQEHPGWALLAMITSMLALGGLVGAAVHISVEVTLSRRLGQFMSTIETMFDKALVHGNSLDSMVGTARAHAEEAMARANVVEHLVDNTRHTLEARLEEASKEITDLQRRVDRLENLLKQTGRLT
jgi:predicted nucleotide-binding protein (sugar kinase/HSP70/actin superfamily)